MLAPDFPEDVVHLPSVRPKGLPRTCSDEELYEAVKAWLLGLPVDNVAEMLHVEPRAVVYWIESPEWRQVVNLCMPEVEADSKGKLLRTMSLSLDELEKRIREGNPVINYEGVEVGKTPVKAKDLASIAKTLSDMKDNVMAGGKGKTNLRDLAKYLEDMVKGKTIEGDRVSN